MASPVKSKNMFSFLELTLIHPIERKSTKTFDCYPPIPPPPPPSPVTPPVKAEVDIIPHKTLVEIDWPTDLIPRDILENLFPEPPTVVYEAL